ncbi:MAG: aminotransferase class I/II-fold pyridoxal phosphate-dependent enzyme [Elusimicrobia bacterium]|nr:aminotransferase class I/II-fold pyridoxal phosphate-dependent enzyme [Elusimicrobiota bacterium]
MEKPQRLRSLPPYLFADLERRRRSLTAAGTEVLNLGIGDPDLPTPPHIVSAAASALRDSTTHRYPLGSGTPLLKRAIAEYHRRRHGIELDPDSEILVLIGSKEGIAHLPLVLVESGETVLVPDPGYPPYTSGSLLAGASVRKLPLTVGNSFCPDLEALEPSELAKAKLLFLNYPNNPTGALASRSFYEKVISWARAHRVWVAQDAAYSEVYFDREPEPFLRLPGAREVGVEFHSLSKTYQMTGWRVGWVCGNREIVERLAQLKDHCDSGVFGVLQEAARAALEGPQDCVEKMREVYRRRREVFLEGLRKLGWEVHASQATFYVWAKVPAARSSREGAEILLDRAQVLATPGVGFGLSGEGYLRFSLTNPEELLRAALERMGKLRW